MKAFVLFVLLGASIATIEGSKCDPAIEAKIKALNLILPKSAIKAAIENGKEVVVGTTKGYYSADTKCLFSAFSKDSFTAIRVPKTGCAVIGVRPLQDIAGGTFEPNSNIKRYHVYQNNGVTAFYKCEPNGQAGVPQGVIKVSESSTPQDATVQKAKEALAAVGIKIEDVYPSACP